ncbi:MAG TPA: cytochrome c [Myxococcota bacterium]|nr:cytochrome c [Myxococcota bacterium]
MKRWSTVAARWIAAFAAGGCTAAALQAADPEPLALRAIMEALGGHMEAAAGAIAREDWAGVAKIAPLIAAHPQPPALEKARILAFIGADAGRFRGHDEQVHAAAGDLGRAAARADAPAVIGAFAELQLRCHGCHAEFRRPFTRHFYEGR